MLFIVGTPIGNLDDLSPRAAKTLATSDIILAEDTRSALTLLEAIKTRFKINFELPTIVSYYKEKEFEKLSDILNWLGEDKNISLISESGMPVISDPGYLLVSTCIKKNIAFTVIPGPTADTTGLIYSGFNPSTQEGGYIFMGFLPKKESQIYKCINKLKQMKKILPDLVFIFYESARRINKTLDLLARQLPDNDVCVCRELTKKFEEIVRGKAGEIKNRTYKGELCLVIK